MDLKKVRAKQESDLASFVTQQNRKKRTNKSESQDIAA